MYIEVRVTFSSEDIRFMQMALMLARRGLGMTAPNPSVGCVVVKDGKVIGRGNTAPGGRPHAETVALKQAGKNAEGATVYVTLEPCCHIGKTHPCSDALIHSRVKRVVVAVKDVNPAVAGGGIAALRHAGIAVEIGLLEAEAREVNAGFFSVHERKRPLVTLKLATSLDGKIALASGESKWITGEQARAYAHLLRAQHDAIMVGAGTVIHDNPSLTCRLPGLETCHPVRVVMDTQNQLSSQATLFTTAKEIPTWVITQKKNATFPDGVKVFPVAKGSDGKIAVKEALELLASQGITRLLVEGGSALATSLWREKLVDRLIWIRAPKVLGNDGKPAVDALNLSELVEATAWKRETSFLLGEDSCEVFSFTQ